MIRKTLLLASIAVFGALAPARLGAAIPDPSPAEASGDSREDRLYEEGTKALDDGDWDRAASSFMEIVKSNGARSDAALYWVAYSYNKQGRKADALAILSGYSGKFPKSSWTKDARALELEIRGARGGAAQPEAETDEDLKLMAINSLMNSDPERALPLLEKLVKSGSSPKIRERALFVLSQSDSPKARQIVADIARDGSNPELQEKAIRNLAIHGGKANQDLLAEIYASPNSSVEVKERILKSFLSSGDKEKVLAAAKGEKEPRLRATAVKVLGAMGARSELWQLYQAESSSDVKHSLINALFVAGDSQHLLELARTEANPELRREAIRKLGVMGKEQTGAALVSIYNTEKDPELRRAAINGLFVQNNAHALVEIARAEKDPAMKKEAVQKLSVMGQNKEATDYLMELLKQ